MAVPRHAIPLSRLGAASFLLILVAAIIYGQMWQFEFLTWDDPMYVTGNRNVFTGLTLENIQWAFQTRYFGLWNPLTWVSLMADASFWGKNPGGFHMTSLALHASAAVALFLFLAFGTGAFWRSLVVALLFAVHPLQVESVAWISGRKDTLVALFSFLTLLFHCRWCQSQQRQYLVLTYLVAVCAGLSKPMAVSLPVMLVLSDIWPLQRFDFIKHPMRSLLQSCREKWPLFAAAAVLAIWTMIPAKNSGLHAMTAEQVLSLPDRLQVAGAAYGVFLWKMLWPVELSFFHPLTLPYPIYQYLAPLFLLLIAGGYAWRVRATQPFVIAGLAWYCLTLLPVSGIIQISAHRYAYADRYAYLPLVGIYIALIWLIPDIFRSKLSKLLILTGGLMVLAALSATAYWQAGHWRDSIALHQRAIDINPHNRLARLGLGFALMQKHRAPEAEAHFERVIDGFPPDTHGTQAKYALGNIHGLRGNMPAAVKAWEEANSMNAKYVYPSLQLGKFALQQGRLEDAVRYFEEADRREPDNVEILNNLGVTHARMGNLVLAKEVYQRAVRSDSSNRTARLNLARSLEKLGQTQEAIAAYTVMLRENPNDAEAIFRLQRLR